MFDFSDRIVIVTGATGNLGGAVIAAFAAAGAGVVAPDRRKGRLGKLFPDLAGSKRHYLADSLDLTDPEAAPVLVRETLSRFGQIDVLVNTLGGYRAGLPPHETSLEDWDDMHNLNARTTFSVCRAVVPAMLERGQGRIISTAARSAFTAGANEVAYSASKSAVARLTESFSAAYRARGINVNAIVPGTIDTPENREAMPRADHARWVPPPSIAAVALFLASEAAAAIHGALIPVYGLS